MWRNFISVSHLSLEEYLSNLRSRALQPNKVFDSHCLSRRGKEGEILNSLKEPLYDEKHVYVVYLNTLSMSLIKLAFLINILFLK